MAAIKPFQQKFEDMRGFTIGISKVKLLSASDTLTVPTLANSNANASSAQVRGANEAAATVTDDGANTVTIVGTVGEEVTVVTQHGPSLVNHGAEA